MKKNYSISVICLIVGVLASCTAKVNKPQPELGARSVAIIEKKGLQFKDLNKNGKLDKYEDWQVSGREPGREQQVVAENA